MDLLKGPLVPLLMLATACGMSIQDPGEVHGSTHGYGLHVRDAVALRHPTAESSSYLVLLSDRPWLCSRLAGGEQLKAETVLYLAAVNQAEPGEKTMPVQQLPQLDPSEPSFTPFDEACQPVLGLPERRPREKAHYRTPTPQVLEAQALTGKFQYSFGVGPNAETLVGSYTARFCEVEADALANAVCP